MKYNYALTRYPRPFIVKGPSSACRYMNRVKREREAAAREAAKANNKEGEKNS